MGSVAKVSLKPRTAHKSNSRFLVGGVALAFLAASFSGGCAQIAVNRALKQYKEQLGPEIGKATKDDYIKAWGPPRSTTSISDGKVCVWYFSYGTRAYASGSRYAVSARAHEMYDRLTMTFDKNGVLQQYRVWCQR